MKIKSKLTMSSYQRQNFPLNKCSKRIRYKIKNKKKSSEHLKTDDLCCGKGERIKRKKNEHKATKTFHNTPVFLEYKNVQASNPEANSTL